MNHRINGLLVQAGQAGAGGHVIELVQTGYGGVYIGEWKVGGWWYYYLYGLAAKASLGLQLLVIVGVVSVCIYKISRRQFSEVPSDATLSTVRMPSFWSGDIGLRDLAILIAPGLACLIIISSQMQLDQHVRYALPVFVTAIVFAGSTIYPFILINQRPF